MHGILIDIMEYKDLKNVFLKLVASYPSLSLINNISNNLLKEEIDIVIDSCEFIVLHNAQIELMGRAHNENNSKIT